MRSMETSDTQFAVADPDGTFLTLSVREATAILEDLREDDDLSVNLASLRAQLEEWLA